MRTYYEILEVSPKASEATIREQYRFLVQAWHPDKFPNPAQKLRAEEKLKEINAAYEVLRHPVRRAEYDARIPPARSRYQQEYRQQATYGQSDDVRCKRDPTAHCIQEQEAKWWRERASREPAETDKRRVEELRRQKISQLDHEISFLNGEIDRLTNELPSLPNPALALGLLIGGVYALLLVMLGSQAVLLTLGGLVSILVGIQLFVSRNRFYRENCKPAYNNIEKHKQHLQQLVREHQYLRNV